jgi:hypothetical protein
VGAGKRLELIQPRQPRTVRANTEVDQDVTSPNDGAPDAGPHEGALRVGPIVSCSSDSLGSEPVFRFGMINAVNGGARSGSVRVWPDDDET